MDEQKSAQLLALRDEEMYHRRRADELRNELERMLQDIGQVRIVVVPVEQSNGEDNASAAV